MPMVLSCSHARQRAVITAALAGSKPMAAPQAAEEPVVFGRECVHGHPPQAACNNVPHSSEFHKHVIKLTSLLTDSSGPTGPIVQDCLMTC